MSAIRFSSVALLASLLLSACAAPNGGVYVNPWSPWGIAVPTVPTYPPATPTPVTYVDVYKYQGRANVKIAAYHSRKCSANCKPAARLLPPAVAAWMGACTPRSVAVLTARLISSPSPAIP